MMRLLLPLLTFAVALSYIDDLGWRSDYELQSDVYLGYAVSMLAGEGYQSCPAGGAVMCEFPDAPRKAYRPPGYPLFLTGVLAFVGIDDPLPSIRVVQALMAALVVALTMAIADGLGGRRASWIAGALMAVHPMLYWLAVVLYTEMLYTLLLLVLAWLVVFRPTWGLRIGVLCGLLILIRGAFVLTAPLMTLLLFFKRYPVRWLFVGLMAVWAPWLLHNAAALHAFVPLTTNGGMTLYGSHVTAVNGMWIAPADDVTWAHLPEVEQDRALSRLTLDTIGTQPIAALVVAALQRLAFMLLDGRPYVEILALLLVQRRLLRRLAGKHRRLLGRRAV